VLINSNSIDSSNVTN